MASVSRMIIAAIALAATACATPSPAKPADMDIDFVRGCWVQKDAPGGKIEAFLRLLPEGDALKGQMTDVATGDWITRGLFAFTRDGERVTFELADTPDQPEHTRIDPARLGASFDWARPKHDGKLAAFAGPAPQRHFLFAEGGGDTLAIWAVDANPQATLVFTLFDGERDGCD